MPSSSSPPPTTTTNHHQRKRSGVSLTNRKRLRRSELIKNSKDERPSRAIYSSNSLRKITNIPLTTENNRTTTLRTLTDSYDDNKNEIKDLHGNSIESVNMQSSIVSFVSKSMAINQLEERKSNLATSYDSNEALDKIKTNSQQILPMIVTPLMTSADTTTKSSRSDNNVIIQQTDSKSNTSTKFVKLLVPQSIKMLSNAGGLSSALRIPTKIQLTKTLPISSIQNEDQSSVLSSTIVIRSEQQSVVDYPLTPPPPPVIIVVENKNMNSNQVKEDTTMNNKRNEEIDPLIAVTKRHDWSVPPTSELSPTSLTSSSPDLSQNNFPSDDLTLELDLKNHRSAMKRRYRPLSLSCPVLPNYGDKSKPITPPYKSKSLSRIINQKKTSSPIMKNNALQRLRKKRKDNQFYMKKFKIRTKNEPENLLVVQEVLNHMIEQVELFDTDRNKALKTLLNTPVHPNLFSINSINDKTSESHSTSNESKSNEIHEHMDETNCPIDNNQSKTHDETNNFTRQTSTPLSFHSIPSSVSIDEQLSPSNQSTITKTHIFSDIVNELIKGAKGLDKLSCSLVTFTNSIHDFIRLTIKKQNEKVEQLQRELEKKCSSQFNRANIFCTQKIQYFVTKHSLGLLTEYIDEITLIVKYFYLYVLSLNCRKQEIEVESILNDLINGKLTFINPTFHSSTLTTIIEDFILPSSLANDYLLSQPLIINDEEISLPFVHNIEYENELLNKNDIDLTSDLLPDLEDYLNRCENTSTIIPSNPIQQPTHPPTYYPNYSRPSSSIQYYHHPSSQSTDMNSYYYYHPSTSNYTYNHPPSYYNSVSSYGSVYNPNEQYKYYYNQSTSYPYSHSNSTNDIPLVNNHPTYRRNNSNIQRKYNNYPSLDNPRTLTGFDSCNNESIQSKSATVPNHIYPS
ncbi:hypothetical protein I4U23_000533 [Adineta vaga]|nr:hypothetical protein I4U23_000533 [Adineta vaga]